MRFIESLSAQISLKFEKIDLMKNSHRRREIEKNKIYIITQVEILISAPNISELLLYKICFLYVPR